MSRADGAPAVVVLEVLLPRLERADAEKPEEKYCGGLGLSGFDLVVVLTRVVVRLPMDLQTLAELLDWNSLAQTFGKDMTFGQTRCLYALLRAREHQSVVGDEKKRPTWPIGHIYTKAVTGYPAVPPTLADADARFGRLLWL